MLTDRKGYFASNLNSTQTDVDDDAADGLLKRRSFEQGKVHKFVADVPSLIFSLNLCHGMSYPNVGSKGSKLERKGPIRS
jgi:hypothetical protein